MQPTVLKLSDVLSADHEAAQNRARRDLSEAMISLVEVMNRIRPALANPDDKAAFEKALDEYSPATMKVNEFGMKYVKAIEMEQIAKILAGALPGSEGDGPADINANPIGHC